MSSKTTKRNTATKVSNVIVTRKKAALQKRHLHGKPKKNEKQTNKTKKEMTYKTKKEMTLPKKNKINTVWKDTPLQTQVRTLVRFVERAEYYPDKLKRDCSNKKILLKPKHNYKVVASSNKRKLSVPQKGLNSPLKKLRTYSSSSQQSEPSMVEMVKLIEDCHKLSDEDFMEILTCPSPVWWEDPPDDGYIEDAICSRNPESVQPAHNNIDMNKTEHNKLENVKKQKNKRENNKTITQMKNKKGKVDKNSLKHVNNNEIKTINDKNINRIDEKKRKLEIVLGNIKNISKKGDLKSGWTNKSSQIKNRRVSNSTDGDMSDLSYNEEEILKNLESLDIPVSQANENPNNNDKFKIYIKSTEAINNEINLQINKNEIIPIDNALVPKILPPLKRKPVLNNNIKDNSEIFNLCSDYNLDMSQSDFRFIDKEILLKNNIDTSDNLKNIDIASQNNSNADVDGFEKDYDIKEKQIKLYFENEDNELYNIKNNDLDDYITVYKIVSNDAKKKCAKSHDNMASNKLGNEKKNMNSFFKKCKNNKRLKKSSNLTSASSIANLNLEKESNEQTSVGCSENRLKTCKYCVLKSQNGAKNFSCADCEKSPLCCDICNFTSEKSVSSCKDVARMSWKHNYLVNET